MDKKIILVLLILLVLAIYYCYTHESFTENFKSVADIVKGGVIEFFESSANNGNITGDLKVSGAIYQGGLTIKQGTASPDNTKIQWGDGSGWRLRFQKDDKNPVMDVSDTGSVAINKDLTVSGRNILGEIDALKGGNASKAGTDTNKAIEDLGKIAAQLLAGGATVPGNLAITSNLTVGGGLTIKPGTSSPVATKIQWGDGSKTGWKLRFQNDDKNPVMDVTDNGNVVFQGPGGGMTIRPGSASPDATKIQWGDGSRSGWRLRFQNDDNNPVMDVYDNGVVGVQNQLIVKGRDILAELDDLKRNVVRKDAEYYLDTGVRSDGWNPGKRTVYLNGGDKSWMIASGDGGFGSKITLRQA